MPWEIVAANGIHLPQIGWHLDASRAMPASFVSHAHSDHIARHRRVICTAATSRLMRARLSGRRDEIILAFGERHQLEDGTAIELHPAGHILGSAQFRAENEHGTLLYTGDFKLRPGCAAELCATPAADTLIMETTFGRPHYRFPPEDEIWTSIRKFCFDALNDGTVPVLLAYSLGKTQELLAGLRDTGLPVMLEAQAEKLTRIYQEFGVSFARFTRYEPDNAAGHVVITPPNGRRAPSLRRLARKRTAAVTGWAVDRGAVYRYGCDAVFPLSDHAGFDDLLRFVERVGPRRVFTVHGFANDFARELRARGIEAWALGRANQLDLGLDITTVTPAREKTPD